MAQTKIKAAQFSGVVGNGVNGYVLQSSGDGDMEWVASITPPAITSLSYPGSATAADLAGGETITITGTGFVSGASVTVGGTAAPAVSFVSETTLTITTPAKAAGDYDVVVTNIDTGSATFINGISYNGIPAWSTAAGSLGTFASAETISTITLAATEPDGGTITFNITNGALPTGLSLTGANIDGTTSLETAETLYTFTVTATDNESQTTPRVFTITVQKQFIATENFTINTYTGNGSTQSIEGKIGTAASFNGSSSYIYNTSTSLWSSDISISAWFKTTANQRSPIATIGRGSWVDGFELQAPSANTVSFSFSEGSKYGSFNSSIDLDDGNWHHYVQVSNSSTAKFFIDGVEQTGITTGNGNSRQGSGIRIGRFFQTPEQWANGSIDQVRIFNKELSSTEVTTLYGESNTSTTKSTTDIFDDSSGVALYEFEEGAKDTGGVTGKIGNGGIFNGSSSYINTNAKIPVSLNFSISFWMKTSSTAANQYMFSTKSNSVTNGWWITTNGGEIWYGEGNGSDNGVTQTSPLSTYADSEWHHVCVTRAAGGTVNMYIDGSRVITDGAVGSNYMTSNVWQNNLHIGRYSGSNALFYNGSIDDARIYSDVLTPTEVGYIYNNTTASIPTDNLIAYYKLNGDARDEQQLYDGTASNVTYAYDGTPTNVSFVGTSFQPDLVWIKRRSATEDHALFDSVRGTQRQISSNLTAAGYTTTNAVSSFNSNGFTTGDNGATNASGQTYVAWNWKAGGTAVSNTDGTITSTVSANQNAGFSIVTWTGDGNDSTVGHGLSQQPELVITKGRANLATYNNWTTYHKDLSTNYHLYLNTSDAEQNGGGDYFRDAAFSSTVIGLGNDIYGVNVNNTTMVAYCFHSVTGYQKIGSYTGTGASGNTITTGFRPRFLLIRNATTSNTGWAILDTARDGTTENGNALFAHANWAEWGASSTTIDIDFTDTGFIIQNGYVVVNGGSDTHIYLAIA